MGYEMDGAFNRAFRHVVGMTPGEYAVDKSADIIHLIADGVRPRHFRHFSRVG
ncbi:hypothetical protein [Ferrovum sp.]|uniref:hypothetical protein n=1 Tax=Ferrovum sp. TaxID=2609467 RepID=UPI003450897A